MTIFINHRTTVGELQQQFHKAYPFLKIEFVQHLAENGPFQMKQWFAPRLVFYSVARRFHTHHVDIYPWDMPEDVNDVFKLEFGIEVCIFRREGYHWLVAEEAETLDLLNKLGRHSIERRKGKFFIKKDILL